MFTGIIEAFGKVESIHKDKENLNLTINSPISSKLKVDQSISHNGVCLTVIDCNNKNHTVTAINETLNKTNLKYIKKNDLINLERAMKLNTRLDGHIVQGHIDQTAECTSYEKLNGSWVYNFQYDLIKNNITIEKGSITINGVSLTVINSKKNSFSVAIIPYTFNNTNFHKITKGSIVNLEFDIIGKYISKLYDINK
ncbi:MAG: riboflavin synthase [Flavobacteriaceae bacterium]|nr:riboflavin synthase [Flavobacteriaceae bacterium]